MIRFSNIPVGAKFKFDHTVFRKTGQSLAWEIKDGRRWKEWAFMPDDKVILV